MKDQSVFQRNMTGKSFISQDFKIRTLHKPLMKKLEQWGVQQITEL